MRDGQGDEEIRHARHPLQIHVLLLHGVVLILVAEGEVVVLVRLAGLALGIVRAQEGTELVEVGVKEFAKVGVEVPDGDGDGGDGEGRLDFRADDIIA
jgi:hypothetical protein